MELLKKFKASSYAVSIVYIIGGLIMLLIGFLIMVKPEWLMFNF